MYLGLAIDLFAATLAMVWCLFPTAHVLVPGMHFGLSPVPSRVHLALLALLDLRCQALIAGMILDIPSSCAFGISTVRLGVGLLRRIGSLLSQDPHRATNRPSLQLNAGRRADGSGEATEEWGGPACGLSRWQSRSRSPCNDDMCMKCLLPACVETKHKDVPRESTARNVFSSLREMF